MFNFLDSRSRSVLAVGAAMSAAAVLAACSGGSGSGSDSSAAPATDTATVTTTETPPSSATSPAPSSSAPSGSGSSTAPAAVAPCAESQLRASIDPRPVTGTADNGKYVAHIVDFRNISSQTCTISGYPGVALVDSTGKVVKNATRTLRGAKLGLAPGDNTVPTVTLTPGAYASAGFEGVNQQEKGTAQAGCQAAPYPKILVTPPNTKTAVPFTVSWPICYSITVHPTNIEKNPPQ